MFKDTHITKMNSWSIIEESEVLPAVLFPSFVGSGQLGFGLDAGGLQGMPDRLAKHYGSNFSPWHVTQADLYVLREGMISSHLWDDEMKYSGYDPEDDFVQQHGHQNFMPLGYLTQSFNFRGETIEGDAIRSKSWKWRREWNLHKAVVSTSFSFDRKYRTFEPDLLRVNVTAFSPHGSESLYLKLERGVAPKGEDEGEFIWNISLPLTTHHDLAIYDQPGSVSVGKRTLLATIDHESRFKPAERYAVVYGVAAEGMELHFDERGWSATMRGPMSKAQSAWLRIDFQRYAGDETVESLPERERLEKQLSHFSQADYYEALAAHEREYAAYWANTADIKVEPEDETEIRRRFMLHMSEYLLRCGNDHTMGGTAQFLLFHQNGWSACSFHDNHYLIDGIARANIWQAAEGNARWMKSVMRKEGRPFPWALTYDGTAPGPAERDRAPMSDANRALLAMRIYELAGVGREQLLRDTVYPIISTVANYALEELFNKENGEYILQGVENDVMASVPKRHEIGTVIMFITVLKKAISYSERLDIDADKRAKWLQLLAGIPLPIEDGKYLPYWQAAPGTATSCWFNMGFYLTEAHEYLDYDTYKNNRDAFEKTTSCNHPWLNSGAASSEIRLGRVDRAEQFMRDTLDNRIHGPGYFEEISPVFLFALPPISTAHGAFLTSSCEQIVLPDFWRPRVYIGQGMPSKLRTSRVTFNSLRANGGLLISGESTPTSLKLKLHHTGEAMAIELILRIPAEAGVHFRLLSAGEELEYNFMGDAIAVTLSLNTDDRRELLLQG